MMPGLMAKQKTQTTWGSSTKYETVNDLQGVTMTIKEGTASPNGFILILRTIPDKNCLYGQFFLLEKKLDGKWYEVPVEP